MLRPERTRSRSTSGRADLRLELAPPRIEPIDLGLRGGELGEALLQRRRVGRDRGIVGAAARLGERALGGFERRFHRVVFALFEIRQLFLWSAPARPAL